MKETTLTTRRRLLARSLPAAAAAAAWSPIDATALCRLPVEGDEDAELLALGRQADEIFARFYAVKAIVDPLMKEYETRVLPDVEAHCRREITPEKLVETMGEIQRDLKSGDSNLEELIEQEGEITGETECIFRRVMAIEAHTPAGFAVKAKCAAFACQRPWTEENIEDADWDDQLVRSLIEALLKPVGERLPWEQ